MEWWKYTQIFTLSQSKSFDSAGYIHFACICNGGSELTDLHTDSHLCVHTYTHSHTSGLLRLQQIYQGLRPGNESFQVETVKRIANVSNAINFLRTLETLNRFSRKFIVLDVGVEMAKEIIINHVRDISLGRRTYHYLLTSLVCIDLGYKKKNFFFVLVFVV